MDEATPVAPESLTLAVRLWYAVIGLEVLHQGFSVAMTLMNKGEARAQIKSALAEGQNYSDAFIDGSIIAGSVLAALVALLILGGVYYLVNALRTGSKKSGMAQRVLIYFSIYFALRVLVLFATSPTTSLPVALYAVDGCIQILVGAAAAVAAYLTISKDAVDWLLKKSPKQ